MFNIGDKVIFQYKHPTNKHLKVFSDKRGRIVEQDTELEYLFKVVFEDGTSTWAFDDELVK